VGDPIAIWAVLPIKAFDDAKQRLGALYDAEFRRRLMMTMVEDVLEALSKARRLAGIIVVTNDPQARALAAGWGARTTDRGAAGGHSAAVKGGASLILEQGLGGMLAVPGDVPGVTADEIDSLIGCHASGRGFSIVPSHDRRGSNGIVATPPDLVALAYGDDSFEPHLAAACALDITPTVVQLEGLGLDIDYPEDLAMLRAKPWRTRTHRFLTTAPGLPFRHPVQKTHSLA
jgi:2-phospho-L-lactate guanylyltransferase